MPNTFDVTFRGMARTQRQLRRADLFSNPGSRPLNKALDHMASDALDYAQSVTHIDTGNLEQAHAIDYIPAGRVVRILARYNPKSMDFTHRYGPVEHARGGDHAFYARTVEERGGRILEDGTNVFLEEYQRDVF